MISCPRHHWVNTAPRDDDSECPQCRIEKALDSLPPGRTPLEILTRLETCLWFLEWMTKHPMDFADDLPGSVKDAKALTLAIHALDALAREPALLEELLEELASLRAGLRHAREDAGAAEATLARVQALADLPACNDLSGRETTITVYQLRAALAGTETP